MTDPGVRPAPKRARLTRAQTQQQTRDDVVEAAAGLFLSQGYLSTTVAQIADAAGRTQGAIYSHFSGKETLCAEVLEARAATIVAAVLENLGEAEDSPQSRIEALVLSWQALSQDSGLTALAAEFALATRNDQEQRARLVGQVNVFKALVGTHVEAEFGAKAPPHQVETAVLSIGVTVAGLAFGQAIGAIEPADTTAILTQTLRVWFDSFENI